MVAATAIIVAVTGLVLWAPGFAGYHHAAIPGLYLALVVAAAAVTAVSAARGTRAALPKPDPGHNPMPGPKASAHGVSMIMGLNGQYLPKTTHDHDCRPKCLNFKSGQNVI